VSGLLPKATHPAPHAEAVIEHARQEFNAARDDMRRMYTEREAFHLAVGNLIRPLDHMEQAMLRIEMAQMVRAATIMAQHILAQPVAGAAALADAYRVANDVMAARGPRTGSDQ
jgi:hypothetical protein